MSTIQDRLRELAHRLRAIPAKFGLREYRVFVQRSTWSGARFGDGNHTVSETEITHAGGAPVCVRMPTNSQMALGNLAAGTVTIGPFTPQFTSRAGTTSGNDPAATNGDSPAVQLGEGMLLRLTGPTFPDGGVRYRITRLNRDHGLQTTIVAEPAGE